MSCEKASRRLRLLLTKARRLGFTTDEVAELPAAKKLLSARVTSASAVWTILVMMALFFGGGAVLILFCAPCISRSAWLVVLALLAAVIDLSLVSCLPCFCEPNITHEEVKAKVK